MPPGQINPATATIDAPGRGYPDDVPVDLIDDGGGVGASVTCTASGGAINSFSVSGGEGYVNPRFILHGGSGGAVSAKTMNLIEFRPGNPATIGDLNVGDIVRVRGLKGPIASFSTNSFFVDVVRPLYGMQANSQSANAMPPVSAGEWSCTTPVQVIGGLDHLDGATVSVLADGNVEEGPLGFSDGCITLSQPATSVLVGLLYTAQLGGLRFEAGEPTAQGRRKQQPALTLRLMDARGVYVGDTWDRLVEVKERTTETYGQPIEFQTGGNFLTVFDGAAG